MSSKPKQSPHRVSYALGAALLFGLSTPFAKMLLGEAPPVLLASLLYLGSGLGLGLMRLFRAKSTEAPLRKRDLPWFSGALLLGGVAAPLLLMIGLSTTPASMGSLLLNMEGVFTALLAWYLFHENVDRRIALGMVLIVGAGLALSWQEGSGFSFSLGGLAIVGACFCWALDNNLTRKVSAGDPFQIASWKGGIAGGVNLGIALLLGAKVPAWTIVAGALFLGFVSYGVSLVLFVLSLRHLGTARTGAYFSIAPFAGALASLLILQEPVGALFFPALLLMGVGVWLHLSERHEHEHEHEPITHSHPHSHDEHHQHQHESDIAPTEPHTHEHTHESLTHSHHHFPDLHHHHIHKHGS